MAGYDAQHRGTQDSYAHYFAAMDAAMRQKVALTTAHFPASGRVADMGSGSGRGTYDLACLHPALEVVGVDINPVAVATSRQAHRRPNLSYAVGDIAERIFPAESLDAVLDSSVLHHVTSFTGYSLERLEECIDNQVAALRAGGALVIRDFLVPDGPDEVLLDLRADDGDDAENADGVSVPAMSTSRLFRSFAASFRSSQNRSGPVPFHEMGAAAGHADEGVGDWRRFRLPLRAAQEFILRKDYRADWAVELQEEYTYWTLDQLVRALERRGLRVVTAMPIRNPWIVANRYRGKIRLADTSGAPLPLPPTNVLVVGERIPPRAGVRIVERSSVPLVGAGFIAQASWRHRGSGAVYDVVERPGRTIDLLPWRREGDRLMVMAKKGFARPIVNAAAADPNLHGTRWSGHITEPLAAILHGEESPDAVERVALDRIGLTRASIVAIAPPWRYLTSPGGIDERVSAYAVELRAAPPASSPDGARELDARQVVRACHVGGMFDARLELGCYRLLRRCGLAAGPWIGAELPGAHGGAEVAEPQRGDDAALSPPTGAPYERVAAASSFLESRRGIFDEVAADGAMVATVERDYFIPRRFSRTTVVALPCRWASGTWLIGIEWRELPAAQAYNGSAGIATAPAWRLPRTIVSLDDAEVFTRGRMAGDFVLHADAIIELGGPYLSTPGVTPELVLPHAAIVASAGRGLRWVRLDRALAASDGIIDAHLAIAVHRLAHAAGLL